MKFTVNCVRVKFNKLGKCSDKIEAETPRQALEIFKDNYLPTGGDLHVYTGGGKDTQNRYCTYKLSFTDEPLIYLISCLYQERSKRNETKEEEILLDKIIANSAAGVESK